MMQSAFAFSVMAALVKQAGARLPTQEIVLARALVSLALSYLLLVGARVSPWGTRRGLLLLRGLVGYVALSCVFYALTHLPLAEATVIQYLHPMFTALLAAVLLRERAGASLAVSMVLSLVGVGLVSRPSLLTGREGVALDELAVAVAIAGAFLSACAYVVVRRLARSEHPLVIVLYFPLVSVPASIPAVVPSFVMPVGWEWTMLAGIGVCTQLGQVYLTRGLQHEPAGRATALSYMQVVFAATWGVLVFGEVPDAWTIVGALLILGGTLTAVQASRRERSPAGSIVEV